jgi:hypothetical protein
MKAIVKNDNGFLRVRAAPNTQSASLGIVLSGQAVEVLNVANDWAAIQLQVGGAPIVTEDNRQPVAGYMFAPMLDFGTAPVQTQQAAAGMKLGVHSMSNGRGADEADRGCKFVLCMDNFEVAARIKDSHPDAVVMMRKYLGRNFPTVQQAMDGLRGAKDPRFVYTGINEADCCGHDGADLRRRAAFDLEMAQAVKQASGAVYAAGTFAMGCPNFVSEDTCNIIREMYAPAYNSGQIAMDFHLYSPTMAHIDDAGGWIWYERRWEFLFSKCGFDPRVRGIYCSETGVDEMGAGGFPGHGASDEAFRHYCSRFIAAQEKPLVVDGQTYPSPFIGAAIFQLGGNGDPKWDAYEISRYVPVLREFYR